MDNRKRMGKNKDEVIFVGLSEPNWCCRMENQISKALPEELRSSLPSIEEIEKELE